MNTPDKDTIRLAVKSLENGINKLLKKRPVDGRSENQIKRLVRHVRHLLLELLARRQALQALLQWFRNEWKRLVSQLVHHPLEILQHALQCFVRCQDGLVLLTSGECRHPVDIQQAQQTQFPSRLATLETRGDGYTCLYKSGAVYSGYGWDEYANETVGIQVRLVASLRQASKRPWDYLERQGVTELLESVLDQQEVAVKSIQQEIQATKQNIVQDIERNLKLAKPVRFATQDKMERLVVSFGEQTIKLERRADNFQISGTSVLPKEWKQSQDWQRCALPSFQTVSIKNAGTNNTATVAKRRRLAIEESDSDEEAQVAQRRPLETDGKRTPKSTGLVVSVETNVERIETEDSLTAIKAQMGANTQGLAKAFDALERENSEKLHPMAYKKEKVQQLKKVLERAQARDEVDHNEVWDARECLRLAYMELGNESLWTTKDLDQALACFEDAQSLVLKQQDAHQRTVESTNDVTEESRAIQRNLMLLLGQATVNTGIVLVESSQERNRPKKRKLNQAIAAFQKVRDLSKRLKEHAKLHELKCRLHSSTWIQIHLDILEIEKLECLASRWMGTALWPASPTDNPAQAIEVFQDACHAFHRFQVPCRSQLLSPLLELAAESFFATSALADLACSSMERLHRKVREARGASLLSAVCFAFQRQSVINRQVQELESSIEEGVAFVKDFRKENGLTVSPETPLDTLKEIKDWWQEILKQPANFGAKKGLPQLGFCDSSSEKRSMEPTARFIISESSRQSKRQQQQSGGRRRHRTIPDAASTDRIGTSLLGVHALKDTASLSQPAKFRTWGDELLSRIGSASSSHSDEHQKQEETIPRTAFKYPSVAPPVPLHVQAILDRSS